jgi:D-glycero-alpha-D-manno-heptose 1-phosphate guanylyltransferase
MESIILAGGFGTRLLPVVPDVPKAMAPIADRPFLSILLQSLAQKGIHRAVLALGFRAQDVRGYFGGSFAGMELAYTVEHQALGTGGAVRLAMTECTQDHVFVFNGDTYLDLEMDLLEDHWQRRRRSILIGRNVADTARFGRLATKDGLVTGFHEKGLTGPGMINSGGYVFNRGQLDHFLPHIPFSLERDYLAKHVLTDPMDLFVTSGLFIDIGVPEDYARAQTLLPIAP